jgi:ribosome-associated protein
MKIDVSAELFFQTARSGGAGGQNVNKVETMVEGYFPVSESRLLSDVQKKLILQKLAHKINAEGLLQVRSQVHRSQLGNKQEVIRKINALLSDALKREKKRISTKPTASSKQKRIHAKKRLAEIKEGRRKPRPED